uniref:Methyltransferase, FkbM family n=1 Tax=Candidatus Kentrum sp. TUN TaxID=2126343 RepID=A0A450ZT59_9GAMM|nr:MAG: methyltransferase, FkbM family [Candidatus Kentron sp. TUN]VFK64723.1 MAG: methyltransferase, FkbM family [Candidatus Kentron sp. TUN]
MGIVYLGVPLPLITRICDGFGPRAFIETGTFRGETAIWAASRFDRVWTVELSEQHYEKNRLYLDRVPNITALRGDSRQVLARLAGEVREAAVFWLDAHYCGSPTADVDDQCPLLGELEAIAARPYGDFVLIDDARLFLSREGASSRWPSIFDIGKQLEKFADPKYVAIIDDVIVAVPEKSAKNFLVDFCRVCNAEIWDETEGLRAQKIEQFEVNYPGITRQRMRQCIGKSDPTILEIGANDGTDTLRFLELFENPRIYCFEPEPRAIERFRKNVGQRPNITLFEMALSDHDGEATFYQSNSQYGEKTSIIMPDGWDLSGSIRKPKEHLTVFPWVTFEESITVRTVMLDTWRREQGIETVDFIWMDVQGAEMDVFRGGTDTLARTRYLYTEYSDRELYEGQQTLARLLDYLEDFKVLDRYPDDVLLENRRDAEEPQPKRCTQ